MNPFKRAYRFVHPESQWPCWALGKRHHMVFIGGMGDACTHCGRRPHDKDYEPPQGQFVGTLVNNP